MLDNTKGLLIVVMIASNYLNKSQLFCLSPMIEIFSSIEFFLLQEFI